VDEGADHITRFKEVQKVPSNPCMLWCFLGKVNNSQNYKSIKRYCVAEGILNQCVNLEKTPGTALYNIGNLVKQSLNKRSIWCWWIKLEEVCKPLARGDIMIIGIDVFHASKKYIESQKVFRQKRSIGAFVSINFHSDKTEISHTSQITEVMAGKELLLKGESDQSDSSSSGVTEGDSAPYQKQAPAETKDNVLTNFILNTCKQLSMNPTTVIVYRDGVGDGQLDIVKDTEVVQVKKALPHAKVIFCVVMKRISERFFIQTADKSICGNPIQGTIVNDLHHLNQESFYLIPTQCELGTTRPTRYSIIEGARLIPLTELQQLTFSLCHLYPNVPDVVKLPLPTMLAHKLADLVGQNLDDNPVVNPNLYKTCYYL